jgi:hypothetical protein
MLGRRRETRAIIYFARCTGAAPLLSFLALETNGTHKQKLEYSVLFYSF